MSQKQGGSAIAQSAVAAVACDIGIAVPAAATVTTGACAGKLKAAAGQGDRAAGSSDQFRAATRRIATIAAAARIPGKIIGTVAALTAGSVRLQSDQAQIDIATGSGHLQAGGAACGIATVTAVAHGQGRVVESALTADTACCICQDGRICQHGGGAIDMDLCRAAIGRAAIPAIQSIAAITADAAGIDQIGGIGQIILVDVDGGIAAGADAPVSRRVDCSAGKAGHVAATPAGSGRGHRELGEVQSACIVVERGRTAGGIATRAADAGLNQIAEGTISGAGRSAITAGSAGADKDLIGVDRCVAVQIEGCGSADAGTACAAIRARAEATCSTGPVRGETLVVALCGYGEGAGDGQAARPGIENGVAARAAATRTAGCAGIDVAIGTVAAEAIGADVQVGDGRGGAIEIEGDIPPLSVPAITRRYATGSGRFHCGKICRSRQ